jgi:hypothetical protein
MGEGCEITSEGLISADEDGLAAGAATRHRGSGAVEMMSGAV